MDTDRLLAALLVQRNTAAPDTKMSSSEVVFGRRLQDLLPIKPEQLKMKPEWHEMLRQRELALARRHQRRGQELTEHTRKLQSLEVGATVAVQNQHGTSPKRWDTTGTVVEAQKFDKYVVKMDGSGRLSERNRRHLPLLGHTGR